MALFMTLPNRQNAQLHIFLFIIPWFQSIAACVYHTTYLGQTQEFSGSGAQDPSYNRNKNMQLCT